MFYGTAGRGFKDMGVDCSNEEAEAFARKIIVPVPGDTRGEQLPFGTGSGQIIRKAQAVDPAHPITLSELELMLHVQRLNGHAYSKTLLEFTRYPDLALLARESLSDTAVSPYSELVEKGYSIDDIAHIVRAEMPWTTQGVGPQKAYLEKVLAMNKAGLDKLLAKGKKDYEAALVRAKKEVARQNQEEDEQFAKEWKQIMNGNGSGTANPPVKKGDRNGTYNGSAMIDGDAHSASESASE